MSSKKLRGKDLRKIGYKNEQAVSMALEILQKHYKKKDNAYKIHLLQDVLYQPQKYAENVIFQPLLKTLGIASDDVTPVIAELRAKIPEYPVYGKDEIEPGALKQMETAMSLPVTIKGALMPDAHQGYGLPIGGVLATDNVIIPYAVGVDIGCRMCMSVYQLPDNFIARHRTNLKKMLLDNTRFGQKETFSVPMQDEVLDREEFKTIKTIKFLHKHAIEQIGTSGSGNHFVEFGQLTVASNSPILGLEPGNYIAVLSHSGSRHFGFEIANIYTKIAMESCQLPKHARHLSWLGLDTEAGIEYWLAMNLAGDYASANHHQIHKRISKALKEKPVTMIENHHNFAWKEHLPDGKEVIVHRKGATPAYKGILGIIPGSMASPAFIVAGKGNLSSLQSASHGAGRLMSRKKAKNTISKNQLKEVLVDKGVDLIGGGTDESPMAYKDIRRVMSYQHELVEILGEFHPKIVRMDG